MKKPIISRPPTRYLATCGLITCTLLAESALAASFSARNAAMGGASVASSKYDAAAGSNAALLTRFGENDDIALVIPAIGAEASDEFEVFDTLDDITALYDQLEQQVNASDAAGATVSKDAILAKLAEIDEKPVRVDAGVLIGIAKPGKSLAMALELRSQLDLFGYANYDPNDATIIQNAIDTLNPNLLDTLGSRGLVFGAQIDELALSFAHEFTIGGMPLAVGITPKYQKVETIFYNSSVRNFDENDVDADQYTEDDSNLNLDVGLALGVSDSVTIGLQLSNLIKEDYKTAIVLGQSSKYSLEPQATAGIAWNGSSLTVALDADLTERQPFDEIDGSQFIRFGVEYDLAGWLQLRAGARQDLKNTREDLLTAGVGISPFNTFHLDLTAAAGDNDTYGAALDLRFTF